MSLVQLIDQFPRALDNNEFIIGVFIDFSKAFDTVDHSLLVKKLQMYCVVSGELSSSGSMTTSTTANSLFRGLFQPK